MLKGNPEIGLYNLDLPKGCELCRMGGKLVVFITGECGDNCYYCPVSEQRFGKDKAFANEAPAENLVDFIYEAYRMRALGAGITGGDPLIRIDKVVSLIKKFKDEFGQEFHIHLYTSGRYVTKDVLSELERAGLDEIRFHPLKREYLRAIEKAVQFNFDVGIEVPAIPGQEQELEKLILWSKAIGVKFVNMNELELTERNYAPLNARGFKSAHGLAGVNGSFETAYATLRKLHEEKIALHYCSSVYKDLVETRTRFLRIIKYSSKAYEEGTGEGTVLRAVVKSSQDLSDYGEEIEKGVWSISPSLITHLGVNEYVLVEEYPDWRKLKIGEKLVYSKPQ
ncbi:radical SAM protein [Sulfolobus acidocaldarius]|uniref:Conserved Archaeal protein n=4 Tax=Sulfolobus acidocaldarius TaxID=2285 RepID=Q4JCI1_SULAC|nr:radical SAM protein [Sulfolobus acidocaldarius]AAY79498.1 conserved Archaeal protein [Sulfolobus acidocaldarius DSM 639]AGE70047.1 hypothetical protein SacN8_00330 [Sulfolobus acidocaldarius N8]AGE72322.1 hypothetical protein SacRon12I_00330 [Sulfolobus acidocaldarius Ron12/I]ALU29527.1 radical SAM protein [Sulfolobus acidocaldarius]ALU32257.1 radical SAM protein [Sulfolobus acidocaldarius]